MALVVVTSASGAPGATTTALGLALTWPRHVLLADCDRDPAQSVQAGYLRGMEQAGRGLNALAHAHREGVALAPELWRQTLPLVDFGDIQRRFLPGFASAGSARLFEHVWPALGESFAALHGQGADALVDAGRISTSGLPLGLLASADVVVVVARSSLRSLAGARIHLETLMEQVRSLPVGPPLALAIVGADRPYSSAEITNQFGLPVWVEVPWDVKNAAVLSDGADEPRRFLESTFMGRLRADAKGLSERLAEKRANTALVTGVRA